MPGKPGGHSVVKNDSLRGAGKHLRTLRERLGLTMRNVEASSALIAERYRNEEFSIAPSRLSAIETKGILPSIHRLYALSVIYRCDLHELLLRYGVDSKNMFDDQGLASPPRTHISGVMTPTIEMQVPVLHPAFDGSRTIHLGRTIEQWGLAPLSYLAQFATLDFTYGYVGSQDFTMYPLLRPGSFIQVDETRSKVTGGSWRSEYERPLYFIETRDGFACCWCSVQRDRLVLEPHPLSSVQVRVLRHPQEAKVLGQVVGVAIRLSDDSPVGQFSLPSRKSKSPANAEWVSVSISRSIRHGGPESNGF